MEIPWMDRFAHRTHNMEGSIIREILKITQLPDVISFAGGLPSPDVFPIDEFIQASEIVLRQHGSQALQYGTTEGYAPLREMICQRAEQIGIHVTPENVMITSGSQQALDLIGKIFIDPGDKICVEAPTYLGAIQAWKAYGAEFMQIDTDEDGMIPASLEKALNAGPKFIYLLPNFQNPTGRTLPLNRREQILDIAGRFGVPIIEDDPYGKLRFEGQHIPPVIALDIQKQKDAKAGYRGSIIYLSTFSKILAPGIRLAWVIAPPEAISKLVQAKQGADLHTATFNQFLAYQVSQDGFLDVHIEKIRDLYGRRRTLMLDMIEEFFPADVEFTRPKGGLFLWVTLPESINTTDLLPKAVQNKVAFVPGAPFFPTGGGQNTMRLNFSNASEDQIMQGMERLGAVLKEELTRK